MRSLSIQPSFARLAGRVLTLAGLLISFSADVRADETVSITPVLSNDNYAAWKAHILPSVQERVPLDTIPWRTTFTAGLKEAAIAEKPVLLWTMNGHPLGCT